MLFIVHLSFILFVSRSQADESSKKHLTNVKKNIIQTTQHQFPRKGKYNIFKLALRATIILKKVAR